MKEALNVSECRNVSLPVIWRLLSSYSETERRKSKRER